MDSHRRSAPNNLMKKDCQNQIQIRKKLDQKKSDSKKQDSKKSDLKSEWNGTGKNLELKSGIKNPEPKSGTEIRNRNPDPKSGSKI